VNTVLTFVSDLLKDLVGQAWTLLGMIIAWLVLDGSARNVVGICILGTLVLWIATFPLRREKTQG
jgi:hypothetical protein